MAKNDKKLIYLDYASATPVDVSVQKSMDSFRSFFANPSAIHKSGVLVRSVIESNREKIAKFINAHSDEIIFTGSGTESVAIAILGTIYKYKGKKIPHIITTSIEHPSVLENCRMLEKNNYAEVTYINPDEFGIINPNNIRDSLKSNTILVSVSYANNEIGTIEPIVDIAKTIRYVRKKK